MQIHILFSLAKTLCNELGHFTFSSLHALIQSNTCKNYNSSRNLQTVFTANNTPEMHAFTLKSSDTVLITPKSWIPSSRAEKLIFKGFLVS